MIRPARPLPPGMDEELLTLPEVARMFRLSAAAFAREVQPHLPPQVFGGKELWYLPAVRLYLARRFGMPEAGVESGELLDAAFGAGKGRRRAA